MKKEKSLYTKLLNLLFDGLMFVVPILEMTEIVSLIPPEWLPVYMIATVVGRRVLRLLEEHFADKSGT